MPASAPAAAEAPGTPMQADSKNAAPSAAASDEETAESYSVTTEEGWNYSAESVSEELETSAVSSASTAGAAPDAVEEFSFKGISYEAVYDDVYRTGEALEGAEPIAEGFSLYSVEGFEESEMLALYNRETGLAVFYRAVQQE